MVVPRVGEQWETLHACYAKACLGPMERRLREGRLKITGFFDEVRVLAIPEAEIARLADPARRVHERQHARGAGARPRAGGGRLDGRARGGAGADVDPGDQRAAPRDGGDALPPAGARRAAAPPRDQPQHAVPARRRPAGPRHRARGPALGARGGARGAGRSRSHAPDRRGDVGDVGAGAGLRPDQRPRRPSLRHRPRRGRAGHAVRHRVPQPGRGGARDAGRAGARARCAGAWGCSPACSSAWRPSAGSSARTSISSTRSSTTPPSSTSGAAAATSWAARSWSRSTSSSRRRRRAHRGASTAPRRSAPPGPGSPCAAGAGRCTTACRATPWGGVKMYKAAGRHAGVNTFPGGLY